MFRVRVRLRVIIKARVRVRVRCCVATGGQKGMLCVWQHCRVGLDDDF